MKNFLAVYVGTPNSARMQAWLALDEAERGKREAAGMQAWMAWGETHKDVIVENGSPLGKTKRVDGGGVFDVRNNLAGYTVVKAESHEAAAKLFENHPHCAIFPGEGVEVMECLPIPGQ